MSDELIKRTLDEEFITLTEVERDPVAAWMTIVDNAVRIEQLERDRKQNGEDYCALMEKHDALHVKLAKAVEALRKIAAYTHIGTHEQGIVQNAEARIACTALADMEGK
jgi:hypothetical protein